MKVLAIDPGSEESALLVYDTDNAMPVMWRKMANHEALDRIANTVEADCMAIEMIASYGMAVGAEVFETCVWIGRFGETWRRRMIRNRRPNIDFPERVYRRNVKSHLCNSTKAKDANVRQALIDRYGGKERAIGRKATPGPLYGLSGDCWSALAVAITAAETTTTGAA